MSHFLDRFLAKTEKTDTCWLWTGAKDKCGYGCMGFAGRVVGAHRVAWELFCGPIPDGMHVLHKCDVRNCVNPAHLWLGTHQENMRDRNRKGRARGGGLPGSACAHAKLSEKDVLQIRQLVAAGAMQKGVAVIYGVDKATVNDIVHRKTWRHI